MKVNNECIKAVLNYVIDNSVVEFDEHIGYKGLSLLSIINDVSNNGTYSKEQVLHSCIYAYKCQYIDANREMGDCSNIVTARVKIYDVTPYGYKFLGENNE